MTTTREAPHEGAVDLLKAILADQPKLTGALCRGRAPSWDTDISQSRVCRAMAACDKCPALAACQRFVDAQPARRLHGVIAGHGFTGAR